MERVSLEREYEADPAAVRRTIRRDPEAFVGAAGFDEVVFAGDRVTFARSLGLASIELTVELDHDADAVLAFDAVEGIFDEMRTEYVVEPTDAGSRVTAWTEFTLGGALASAFDGTLVATQRRREFADQLEYLESALGEK
ncbi:MAG: SRPBCC family protein [Halanaeroarchaeum sp.]